jgi:hypothetical protein
MLVLDTESERNVGSGEHAVLRGSLDRKAGQDKNAGQDNGDNDAVFSYAELIHFPFLLRALVL